MTRNVYIVRHGNTFDRGDIVTRVGARTDLDLSSSGREQAEKLACHFAAQSLNFGRILSSPLKRTLQTAAAIQKSQPDPVQIVVTDFLREIDYGPDENKPEPEVVARIGKAALAAWENDATPPPGWKVDKEGLITAWRALLDELATENKDGPVLVVTSNGIARFALMAINAASEHDLKLKTGAYGIIRISEGAQPAVTAWNMRP